MIRKKDKIKMDSEFTKIENPVFYMYDSIILAVGITGSGKSSFLNTLVNYLLEKTSSKISNFIYSSNAGASHTYGLTYYSVRSSRFGKLFLLIDTPGFSDTYGHFFDDKNFDAITSALSSIYYRVSFLYFINSTVKRVTESISRSIEYISKLIGENSKLNIYMILTFASDQFHEMGNTELDIGQRYDLSGIWVYYDKVYDVDNIFSRLIGKKIKSEKKTSYEALWNKFCTEKLNPLVRSFYS